jgi:hypothetical protein
MTRPLFLSVGLACLLAMTCQGRAAASDAYSDAYRSAQTTGKLLLVTVGVDGPVLADPAKFVVARLPAGFVVPSTMKSASYKRTYGEFDSKNGHVVDAPSTPRRRLSAHPALSQMGGNGAFIARVARDPCVISALPARYCTPDGLWALVNLPPGTLTQRTLIWAVRMHQECPHSADGQPDASLVAQATAQSDEQVRRCNQGHWLPHTAGQTSEVCSESWPRDTNIVDGAVELVRLWRTSAGHWGEVRRRHSAFGYDMRWGFSRFQGGNVWFGTGCFRN